MTVTQVATYSGLDADDAVALSTYRYQVFVEHLGWELPQQEVGRERDQFDGQDTVYAWARDSHGSICGCARLLPTTGAYLLEQVFPQLLDGASPPHAADVWELSRYTTERVDGGSDSIDAAQERFRELLLAVVLAAMQRGAKRLITFSYVGVERIARRFGLHVHRVG
ncbi:MAG: GNAT family N-acetyltransferase, partial [Xanthomonadales bacterium]|nr:GNAT family N-acetyltransferase [Xanthomonadales bacterium]